MTKRLFKAIQVILSVGKGVFDARRRARLREYVAEYQEEDIFFSCLKSPGKKSPKAMPQMASEMIDAFFPKGLLVTTSEGLFLLKNGSLNCLFPVRGFGVTVDTDGAIIFCASPGVRSYVLRSDGVSSGSPHSRPKLIVPKILNSFETRYHGDRIHGIALNSAKNSIKIALTRRNTILEMDSRSGAVIREDLLFADGFGTPIRTDHHHINGLCVVGDKVLFSAHTFGSNGGGLGFVDKGRVYAYKFRGRGIHDVLLHDGGLVFTDSFGLGRMAGEGGAAVSGAVIYHGEEVATAQFDSFHRKFILRGLTIRNKTIVVGASINAKRNYRFSDSGGGIFLVHDFNLVNFVELPVSQVYDVLPLDGVRDDKQIDMASRELKNIFLRTVGPLVYEGDLQDEGFLTPLR